MSGTERSQSSASNTRRPITRPAPGELVITDRRIKSSARPAAPNVLYAVPTFAWDGPFILEPRNIRSSRNKGGLRVYLDRPWWSSGEGELLGVLVQTGGFASLFLDDVVRPYVTMWGVDPIFKSPELPALYPTFDAFPMSPPESHGFDLSLDEMSSRTVDVAGHDVGFDEGRGLWFCDIDVDWGESYTPFVRLALARYQPNSLPGLELSRVVLADYMQLTPERSVTIARPPLPGHGKEKITVTLTGPSYEHTSSKTSQLPQTLPAPGPGYSRVIVEKRVSNINSEIGWKQLKEKELVAQSAPGDQPAVWSAQLTVPTKPAGDIRLVVEQFEMLQTGQLKFGSGLPKATFGRRLVFSDVIPLDLGGR